MPPPELTRDAPVLDIIEPLVVGVDPIVRVETDLAAGHNVQCFLRDGFAIRTGFAHRHKPLIGQHGFDNYARAIAAWHFQFVFIGFFQDA